MAGTPSSLISSAARPLRLRKRADLQAGRQQYQGTSFWVVKDPLALNYFRFHDEEYALLEMLDASFDWQLAPLDVAWILKQRQRRKLRNRPRRAVRTSATSSSDRCRKHAGR